MSTATSSTTLFAGDAVLDSFRPIVLHDKLQDGYVDVFYKAARSFDVLEVSRLYPEHDRFTTGSTKHSNTTSITSQRIRPDR
jgi:hypothetical protein